MRPIDLSARWWVAAAVALVGLQGASATGAETPAASRAQTCAVDALQSRQTLTSNDLALLMNGYFERCQVRLFSAVNEVFAQEARDPGWAAPLEEKIKQAGSTVPGTTIKGECHGSLCRYDFKSDSAQESGELLREFKLRLLSSANKPEFTIGTIFRATSPDGYELYVYDAAMPAAFVDPLRKRMDDKLTNRR